MQICSIFWQTSSTISIFQDFYWVFFSIIEFPDISQFFNYFFQHPDLSWWMKYNTSSLLLLVSLFLFYYFCLSFILETLLTCPVIPGFPLIFTNKVLFGDSVWECKHVCSRCHFGWLGDYFIGDTQMPICVLYFPWEYSSFFLEKNLLIVCGN